MSRGFCQVAGSAAVATVAALGLFACNGAFRFDDLPSDGGSDGGTGADAPLDSSGGSYSHCASDPDCILPLLHCDILSATCVECVDDSNCKTGSPRCDGALHRCVECGVDQDCAQTPQPQTCEPTTHSCIQHCTEATSSGCDTTGPTPFCSDDKGKCVQCTNNAECLLMASKTECDSLSGRCSECDSDLECPTARPHCDRLHDICVECTSSATCPPALPLCDPSSYACVAATR